MLPRLRADVPAGDAGGDRTGDADDQAKPAIALVDVRRAFATISAQVQPRPRLRAARPFPGELQIRGVGGAKNPNPSPTPEWGLHLLDANIALGNVIRIVKREIATYART